ncbi:MAG: DUF4382 domain-containing protein [Nitrososphaerales archaeon]
MAIERKHLVISAIAGVLLAGLIIAGSIFLPYILGIISRPTEITSIPDENPPDITTPPPSTEPFKMGTLVLILTDAPPRTLKYLYITIDEVRLRMEGNKTGEGVILKFSMESTEYNVTKLKYEPATLIGSVPNGEYTAIWLHIAKAKATFEGSSDGNVTLKIVAGGWLKIPIRYKVHSEKLTVVKLDFDLGQTHVSQGMVLTPVIRPEKVLGP